MFPDLVIKKTAPASEHPAFKHQKFAPQENLLPIGHVKQPGYRAFSCETIFTRDQEITMRDGAHLYADIFRPASSSSSSSHSVPAILPWSPYGKTGTGAQNYDTIAPFRAGIPKSRTSGYEKFEAPDPAEWCARGYAVINIDARGAGHSEGVISFWGPQEAEDVYDVIDWVAQQPWCNGSVVMAGNSWLAISQVNFVARLSHPALKAIAPWEMLTDPYRHFVARGGRLHIPGFHRMISGGFAGPNGAEDIVAMFQKRPLYDEYWECKRIPVEKITDVPMYVLASYSSMLHTYGSFQTFREAKTDRKWLRIHPYQEWYDIYREDISDELQRYFDFYAKGEQNGWEVETPPVRLSLLGFESGGSPAKTVVERPESAYPPQRQKHRTFFLDASSGALQGEMPQKEASVSYEGHHLTDCVDFRLYFDKHTELAGYCKATVWVSCQQHNDMDITVQIRKINAHGNPLKHLNYPCPVPEAEVPDVNTAKCLGPQGFLRASHRNTLDRKRSPSEVDLVYSHAEQSLIAPGSKVRLEIPIWPIGMVFAPGEGVLLRIAGHDLCLPETEGCRLQEPEDRNVGMHTVHTGGRFDSCLTVSFIMGYE